MALELSDAKALRKFCLLPVLGWLALLLVAVVAPTQHAHAWEPIPFPTDTTENGEDSVPEKELPPPLEFKPTIGLGAGMFTFYGDIASNHKNFHPTVSRLGYNLQVTHPVNKFLDLTFYVIHGTVGANERTLERNLNFESKITTGGMVVAYNFHHLLPEDRVVEPFIFTGFEGFEFLSKTDLLDANGNEYHYWSDGSIRNIAESASNADDAIRIYRDYTYESDVRELDIDGFGKYPERSWAVPIGVGANFLINDDWTFKIGTSMHFTLTDFVDGVTSESTGSRSGTAGNDKFLFTSFSVNYNLNLGKKDKEDGIITDGPDTPYIVISEDDDADGDEVFDLNDNCPDTPEGVEVDLFGCPLDGDKDGVPDYMDQDLSTDAGALVDENGIAVEDTVHWLAYNRFVDSTGAYADYNIERSTNETAILDPSRIGRGRKYTVVAGGEEKTLPQDMVDYILSLPDVETELDENGNVIYNIGSFEDIEPAMLAQIDLANQGIDSEVEGSENGTPLTDEQVAEAMQNANLPESSGSKETVFRVQIGAFSRQVPEEIFEGVPKLVVVKGDDGLYRYLSGSYDNMSSVAEHKVNMVLRGFEGSFIVAYRDGKRISLQDAGATIVTSNEPNDLEDVTTPSSVDKSRVKFGVQVGAYANEVPTDVLQTYLKLGNVTPKRSGEVTKYVLGPFDSYEEAAGALSGTSEIPDAFVVGMFNGSVISAEEARQLLED